MERAINGTLTSVPVQFSLLGPPEIPDPSSEYICGGVRWVVAECICPTGCDCQDFERGLVSNHCSEHAWNVVPYPDCPLCAR